MWNTYFYEIGLYVLFEIIKSWNNFKKVRKCLKRLFFFRNWAELFWSCIWKDSKKIRKASKVLFANLWNLVSFYLEMYMSEHFFVLSYLYLLNSFWNQAIIRVNEFAFCQIIYLIKILFSNVVTIFFFWNCGTWSYFIWKFTDIF